MWCKGVCTHHFYYNSDQSHQGSENIAMDHTLDHLMGQEAAAEAGVIAGAEVTAGAWAQVLSTLGEKCSIFCAHPCTLDSECEYFVSLVRLVWL